MTLWNSLPANLKQIQDFKTFATAVKSWFKFGQNCYHDTNKTGYYLSILALNVVFVSRCVFCYLCVCMLLYVAWTINVHQGTGVGN